MKKIVSVIICLVLCISVLPAAWAICADDEHTFTSYGETDADCETPGYEHRICTSCGYVKSTVIQDALGHDWKVTGEKKATCKEDGWKEYECSRCGDTKTETVDATGHDWGKWVITKIPGVTEDGEKEQECSICGAKEKETIEAAGAVPCYITKHPGGENVKVGDSAVFTSIAEYYTSVSWRFVSADGKTTVQASEASSRFPGLKVSWYKTSTGSEMIELGNIPKELDGWTVGCKFVGFDGVSVYTNNAKINVAGAAPTPTPTATPQATPTPTPSPTPTVSPSPTPDTEATPSPTPSAEVEKNEKEKSGSRIPFWLYIVVILFLAVACLAVYIYLENQETQKTAAKSKKSKKPQNSKAAPVKKKTGDPVIRCTNCGKQFKPGELPRFCPDCGNPLGTVPTRPQKTREVDEINEESDDIE